MQAQQGWVFLSQTQHLQPQRPSSCRGPPVPDETPLQGGAWCVVTHKFCHTPHSAVPAAGLRGISMRGTRTKRAKCISRRNLRPPLDTALKMKLLLPGVDPEARPTPASGPHSCWLRCPHLRRPWRDARNDAHSIFHALG